MADRRVFHLNTEREVSRVCLLGVDVMKKSLKIFLVVVGVFSILAVGMGLYFYNIKDIVVLYENALNENEEYYDLAKENYLEYYYDCKPEYTKIKTKFKYFPLYGFKKGKIYIQYSKECFEEGNSEPQRGSWDIPVELEIEKINGKWKIVSWGEEI